MSSHNNTVELSIMCLIIIQLKRLVLKHITHIFLNVCLALSFLLLKHFLSSSQHELYRKNHFISASCLSLSLNVIFIVFVKTKKIVLKERSYQKHNHGLNRKIFFCMNLKLTSFTFFCVRSFEWHTKDCFTRQFNGFKVGRSSPLWLPDTPPQRFYFNVRKQQWLF